MRPSLATAIRDRLADLVREAEVLGPPDYDDADDLREQYSSQRAWFVAVENLVDKIVDSAESPYGRAIAEIAARFDNNSNSSFVQDAAAVLKHLQKEIAAGLDCRPVVRQECQVSNSGKGGLLQLRDQILGFRPVDSLSHAQRCFLDGAARVGNADVATAMMRANDGHASGQMGRLTHNARSSATGWSTLRESLDKGLRDARGHAYKVASPVLSGAASPTSIIKFMDYVLGRRHRLWKCISNAAAKSRRGRWCLAHPRTTGGQGLLQPVQVAGRTHCVRSVPC